MTRLTARRRLASAAFVVALVGTVATAAPTLRVSTWSEYLDPATLARFTQETGVTVIEERYRNAAMAEAILLAGGSGVDLAIASSEAVPRLAARGAIGAFDRALMPAYTGIDHGILRHSSPAGLPAERSVPYLWGTVGLGYRSEALNERLPPHVDRNSWSLIFNPAVVERLADCGVALIDSPEEVVGAALQWLGHDPRAGSPAALAQALAAVQAVAPFVTTFTGSLYGELAEGEHCLVLGWSTDVLSVLNLDDESDLVYAIPREGGLAWLDVFVIPADAPNRDAAHRFVDFMLRPDNSAAAMESNSGASLVPAARAVVRPEIRDSELVFPPPDVMERLVFLRSLPPAEQAYIERAWDRIKAGLPLSKP